jgi:para-nitrobenzyl esterase
MADLGRPVYEYYFTKDNKSLSNFHAGEIPYAYGNLWRNKAVYDQEDFDLSKIMQSYWVNFAKTGDPNGDGLPTWTQYSKESPLLMEFNVNPAMTEDPYTEIYKVLDKYQNNQ